MQDRPIFVVGFQRSGTTLLQSILGRHPRIAAAPELHFWQRVFVMQHQHGSLDDDENLRSVVRDAVEVPWDLWSHVPIDPEAVAARVKRDERSHEAVFRAVMDEFAAITGKPRWSEKSPGQQVWQCRRLAPHGQVVHIVRSAEDVVASSLEMPWEDRSAGELARSWTDFNLRAIQAGARAGPDAYLRVRYEDLVRGPEPVVRMVMSFLQEPFEEGLLRPRESTAVSEVAADWQGQAQGRIEPQPGRAGLGRLQQAAVAAAAAPLGSALGYPSRRRLRVLGRLVDVGPGVLRLARQVRARLRPAGPEAHARRVRERIADVDRLLRSRDSGTG